MPIPSAAQQLIENFAGEDFFCLLLSNGYSHAAIHGYDWICGIGIKKKYVRTEAEETIKKVSSKWLFGHVNFEWNNPHPHPDTAQYEEMFFPQMAWIEPKIVVAGKENESFTLSGQLPASIKPYRSAITEVRPMLPVFDNEENYSRAFSRIYKHLLMGDTYELNYCLHAHGSGRLNPVQLFFDLNALSEAPHAVFYKLDEGICVGASPERFIKKTGKKLETSPIKGTAPRFPETEMDNAAKEKLQQDPKEIKENVMVADLSRNDLSKVASRGSVKVEELCCVKSYKQVHQMESTVSCELMEDSTLLSVLQATFPMASMTGMPKKRVLEIVADTERSPRNLYSGSIVCMAPGGDFDSLVVIRSILYNAHKGDISISAGSAITDMSEACREYDECLVKAQALTETLKKSGIFI